MHKNLEWNKHDRFSCSETPCVCSTVVLSPPEILIIFEQGACVTILYWNPQNTWCLRECCPGQGKRSWCGVVRENTRRGGGDSGTEGLEGSAEVFGLYPIERCSAGIFGAAEEHWDFDMTHLMLTWVGETQLVWKLLSWSMGKARKSTRAQSAWRKEGRFEK